MASVINDLNIVKEVSFVNRAAAQDAIKMQYAHISLLLLAAKNQAA
ncbi:hypothetical protein GW590_08935 [Rahnella sp. SAP-1]|uniref:Uncharacterized protein n=1 Tax=Rouxiella aceris TaxID=2703884 RepID=A0A848MIT0_9GAMM|nr:hypothetical protein [Rouxiella aceris]NMP26990.1 hypothetical protein [Rouxiella aceris]